MTSSQPIIAGVGGTLRAGSSSEVAIRSALEHARRFGAETRLVTGQDLLLPMYDPNRASDDPSVKNFLSVIRAADGIIIASPGYHGSISGLLKNALDYVEELRTADRPYFEGRAIGCIACAYGWQATTTTLLALRSIVHALRGWPTPLGVIINSAAQVFDSGGRCIDNKSDANLAILAEQVVEFAHARSALLSSNDAG